MGQCSSRCPPLNIFVSLCAVLIFAVLRQLKSTIMSSAWPSAYGYKYTPIGLRQRERKEDTGKRYIYPREDTFSTSSAATTQMVHRARRKQRTTPQVPCRLCPLLERPPPSTTTSHSYPAQCPTP